MNKNKQKWIVDSTYALSGNCITDVVYADTEKDAWIEANKLKDRIINDVRKTDWDGLTNTSLISGGRYIHHDINLNNYNPD